MVGDLLFPSIFLPILYKKGVNRSDRFLIVLRVLCLDSPREQYWTLPLWPAARWRLQSKSIHAQSFRANAIPKVPEANRKLNVIALNIRYNKIELTSQ